MKETPPVPSGAEWQYIGDETWIYGVRVRGIVRKRLAEVYWTEGLGERDYGWKWLVYSANLSVVRGNADRLEEAIEAAEKALGDIETK